MTVSRILLLALLAVSAHAQADHSWQGEWGAFTGVRAEQGRRLSIHDCSGNTCRFSLVARSSAGRTETSGDPELTLLQGNTATARLPDSGGKAFCDLSFRRLQGAKPSIEVAASGTVCTAYYATSPEIFMSGSYPLRSTTPYSGAHADECFLGTSPALLATCTHPELALLEQKWMSLADEYPLHPPPAKESLGGNAAMQLDRALLRSCDSEADAQACLTKRYADEIAAMQTKKTAYLAGTEERGDPAVGGPLARKIAGRYRNSIKNGDVQGHSYITTDTLTINPVGSASIHFQAELYFYNGHSCSLGGGALFRRDGSFVYDDKPGNDFSPNTPVCRLAIIPDETGVQFKDITGGCKDYCGERGSWNGEGFRFRQRSPPSPEKAKK